MNGSAKNTQGGGSGSYDVGSSGCLQKSLNYYELTAIGVGSIIGCGIFFLFSNILQRAGSLTALAFIFAAIPNIIAGMAYAELAGIYDSNAVEYDSLRDAFNENIATVSIYVLLLFLVFNAATIIIFAGHLLNMESLKFYFSLIMLLVLSIINFTGIDVSKVITNVMSIVEVVILLIIVIFGCRYWHMDSTFFAFNKNPMVKPHTFWVASFLAIFLYTGYDAVVKLSEETIDSKETVPKAVLTTVILSSVFYILVAFTAVCMPHLADIAKDVMPIAKMCEYMFGQGSHLKMVYLAGLFIVLNTFFVCIISLSRFVYSLSKEDKLPPVLSEVNDKFKTPHNAIIVVFIAIGFALLVDNGEWTASFANLFFLLFIVMLLLAVIILRIRSPNIERTFRIPFAVNDIPIPVVLGIIVSVGYFCLALCSIKYIG